MGYNAPKSWRAPTCLLLLLLFLVAICTATSNGIPETTGPPAPALARNVLPSELAFS
jgi:hypothetical protein